MTEYQGIGFIVWAVIVLVLEHSWPKDSILAILNGAGWATVLLLYCFLIWPAILFLFLLAIHVFLRETTPP
jgi:hypothetical protein